MTDDLRPLVMFLVECVREQGTRRGWSAISFTPREVRGVEHADYRLVLTDYAGRTYYADVTIGLSEGKLDVDAEG